MISTGISLANASMIAMAAVAVVATVGAFVDPEWYAEKRKAILTAASLLLLGWLARGGVITYRVIMTINADLALHPDSPLSSLADLLSGQASTWTSLR